MKKRLLIVCILPIFLILFSSIVSAKTISTVEYQSWGIPAESDAVAQSFNDKITGAAVHAQPVQGEGENIFSMIWSGLTSVFSQIFSSAKITDTVTTASSPCGRYSAVLDRDISYEDFWNDSGTMVCFSLTGDLKTVDCKGHTITGRAGAWAIVIKTSQTSNRVYIKNCVLDGSGILGKGEYYASWGIHNNTITNSDYGIYLQNVSGDWPHPGAAIYKNNIYDNRYWNVYSNRAIELSSWSDGNYWGRKCPADLFVAGVDTNAAGVKDSHPYCVEYGWEQPPWLSGCRSGCPGECEPGEKRPCYTGSFTDYLKEEAEGLTNPVNPNSICQAGEETCINTTIPEGTWGGWGPCENDTGPYKGTWGEKKELCFNLVDDMCDNMTA